MSQFKSFRPVEFDENFSYRLDTPSAAESKIIACLFLGYCIDNQPETPTGCVDVYTPFYETYYNERKLVFHRQNIQNISLIRKPQKLEERFVISHINEEKQGFEMSKTLFAFLGKDNSDWFRSLYYGYMEYLDERKLELGITEEIDNRGRDWLMPERLVDRLKLEELFVPSFFDKTFSTTDMLMSSERLSRFDVLCNRIEMVLTDETNPVTNKSLGSIAYMLYSCEFVKPMYRKPSRPGERGRFSKLLVKFFDIVHKEHPSDTHFNKYQPTQETIDIFGNILNYF